MATWTALTTLPGKPAGEALGAALEALEPAPTGVGVFEIEDGSGLWEVGGYFEARPDETGLALLAAAFGAKPFAISELPQTDWVAYVQRQLAPVEAGRFHLFGRHDADSVPAGRVGLLIDAAMAFGTGHHGTTAGCLEAFDALLAQGMAPGPVADIGCGTAVLAMAAAKVWAEVPVVAGDIDPVAVEVAEANLAANGLEGRVTCVQAAGTGHPAIASDAPYAVVFANILKGPLIELAPDLAHITAPVGRLILAGLLNDQAADVAAAYADQACTETARLVRGDWTILTLTRTA
ncbi:MAG: 50S ribosomal protein L11 methyltransferase [Pseudomonadota bacterium]